jgi:hypothetical protein
MALFTEAEIAAQKRAVESYVKSHGRPPTQAQVFDILGWDFQAFKHDFESADTDPDPLKWSWRHRKLR